MSGVLWIEGLGFLPQSYRGNFLTNGVLPLLNRDREHGGWICFIENLCPDTPVEKAY